MPSSFKDDLIVKNIGTRKWEIYRDFTYEVGFLGSGDKIVVPKGFQTDFASIPRFFWRIMPPDGEYTKSAIIHDYLYNTRERPREIADKIFLEAMGVLGVPGWKKNIIFRAVRIFGGFAWKKKKEILEEAAKFLKNPFDI